ncbi:MAG: energy transducer TonB [Candidatus Marinimicrobia bacterium]|nr:energy transducer TonB [Candidatus Neomarinimicrobiota bacterium]MDP7026317.1 energy transducer TonB [Candidatus Neomarinimicrobiota bacterium]
MIIRKDYKVSLKYRYPVMVRGSILFSLLLLVGLSLAFPRFVANQFIDLSAQRNDDDLDVDIPQTEQFEQPPPPARPSIPVASDREDLADDVTIEDTDFEDFIEWDAPPPPPSSGPNVKFIAYDDPPVPVGGYGAIQRNIIYPEIAQEAGIEGKVIIQAFIDDKGRVQGMSVLQGIPNTGLNEAAMAAIKKTRFKPAQQRDRPVGVYISIPVNFKLKG